MANEFGLDLVEITPFHEYYEKKIKIEGFKKKFLKMKVVCKKNPNFPQEQWEINGLYSVFVFQKRGSKEVEVKNTFYRHFKENNEIIKIKN